MSGKRSRAKGHSFERKIAKRLRDEGIFPNAERQLEYQENQCSGVDLANTGALKIQCKRMKKSIPMSKLYEVKAHGIACLVSKVDREDTLVTMKFDDFLKILKDIGEVYQTSGS